MYQTKKGIEYQIVKRPLVYYEISVINANGRRNRYVTPVSIECDAYGMSGAHEVVDGETIIGCVPAVAGSFMVYIEFTGKDDRFRETELGIEIPGATHECWDTEALMIMEEEYGGQHNV